jgi:hypothetical protein
LAVAIEDAVDYGPGTGTADLIPAIQIVAVEERYALLGLGATGNYDGTEGEEEQRAHCHG